MTYELILIPEAQRHLKECTRAGQKKVLAKIAKLSEGLTEHPRSGTGQIEQLKGDFSGLWSRRIDKASRMIYSIEDDKVIVTVISLKGHYNDK